LRARRPDEDCCVGDAKSVSPGLSKRALTELDVGSAGAAATGNTPFHRALYGQAKVQSGRIDSALVADRTESEGLAGHDDALMAVALRSQRSIVGRRRIACQGGSEQARTL
jgi:hypothetical protein